VKSFHLSERQLGRASRKSGRASAPPPAPGNARVALLIV
jgi:hypothetical protein